MHLARAGLAQHLDHLARRGAPHDRVVDHDQPLASDALGQRVQLHADPDATHVLARLDEGAPDVAVLHQTVAVRHPGLARVALSRGDPGLRYGHHHVRVDRGLAGERLAHARARRVHAVTVEPRVRSGEVDELEEAQPRFRLGVPVLAAQTGGVDDDHLARLHVPHVVGTDDVECRGLAGEHPAAALQPTEHQRPEAVRVADTDEVRVVHQHEREAAAQLGKHLLQRELQLAAVRPGLVGPLAGHELGDERGVGGGVEVRLVGRHARQHPEAGRELRGVGQVAVVPEREAGVADGPVDRLRVLPGRRAGGRVAVVADGQVALQRREPALVEHLRDEAHVLRDRDRLAVAHRDPGRLLTPVLECEQPEVGQLRDVLAGPVHAEDTTGMARGLVRCGIGGVVTSRGKHRVHYPTTGAARMIEGIASRQAWSASASDTENAPSAWSVGAARRHRG